MVMKMKKLMTLGVIAPMFAIATSCSGGIKKISFDEAFNFAVKNYDQYYHLGYEPIYNLKVNKFAIQDTKMYRQIIDPVCGSRTYEQTYYIDTTIKDLGTTIDTDEIPVPHVNSVTVRKVASYLSIAEGLLGYFDAFFTLEDNKYLGAYVGSHDLEQVVNLAGAALSIIGLMDSESAMIMLKGFEMLNADSASLKVTASCNNLGLLDQAHAYLEIDNLSCSFTDKFGVKLPFSVITSKCIAIDAEFIVDYSGK